MQVELPDCVMTSFKLLPFPLLLLCLTSSSMSAGLLGPVLCLLADGFLDLLFKLFCRDEDDCCCLFFFLGLTVKRHSQVSRHLPQASLSLGGQ